MATVFLMCGLTFSGKSTIAKRIASAFDCDYLSLDQINEKRGLWGGHGLSGDEWERTHQIALARMRKRLDQGRCVVVDDTSNLRWLRDRFRDTARENGHDLVLVYVTAPVSEIRRRIVHAEQTGERRGVTDGVLEEHIATFQEPHRDESPIRFRFGEQIEDLLKALEVRFNP